MGKRSSSKILIWFELRRLPKRHFSSESGKTETGKKISSRKEEKIEQTQPKISVQRKDETAKNVFVSLKSFYSALFIKLIPLSFL